MDNNGLILILLIIVCLVIWFVFLSPQAQEKKAEQKRIEAEIQKNREAEINQLKKEREDYIKSVRENKPNFILQARIEFERAYKASGGGTSFFGQEKSPLACFGYIVGKTKGRKPAERKQIIEYTLCADIPDFFPKSYSMEWGAPLSVTRFKRIHSHLTSMADLRASRTNFAAAVSDWRADADWMRTTLANDVLKYGSIN